MTFLLSVLAAVFGFALGMLMFLAVPIVAGSLPDRWAWPILMRYASVGQSVLGRSLAIPRDHAGLEIVASKYDTKMGGEYCSLGRRSKHFRDVDDRMSYLSGYPFGIAPEADAAVVDPVAAAIGERRREVLEAGENVCEFEAVFEEGDDPVEKTAVREHVSVPKVARGVRMSHAEHVLGGDAAPENAETAETFVEISQQPFQSRDVITVFTFVGIFVAVLGVMWLAVQFASGDGSSGGGGGGVSLTITGMEMIA